MADSTLRDRYDRRLGALRNERSSFMSHWKQLSEFINPRRGRFEITDHNRGDRRHGSIINSRAGRALRTATAGMFNGIMSPSRPWVILGVDDQDLLEFAPVKKWLFDHQTRMLRIFNDTNLYSMAPITFRETILFGTGCLGHEDDRMEMARFYAHTIGSYFIAQNDRMEVDTLFREFEMTVEQIVSQFSRTRSQINPDISQAVKDQYDRGNYDVWYPVVHVVEPNPDATPYSRNPRQRRYRVNYYEKGQPDRDKFLFQGGDYDFPFYCPRWERAGEDVYGTNCPGMEALGDVKQLQLEERRKAQGLDKMVAPVMSGPPSLRNVPTRNMAGHTTIFDGSGGQQKWEPAYEVRLPIGELTADIKEVEQRINEAFYVDLFNAISAMEGVQPRNQLELSQRNQERLLELGPALTRWYSDFLDMLVARSFRQMVRAGLVTPPPKELQRQPLVPRYVSPLALAQESSVIAGMDRLIATAQGLSGIPGLESSIEKLDGDQLIDEYAKRIGVPPTVVLDDETLQKRRQQRMQMESVQQAIAAAQGAADVAKTASETDLSGDSMAGRMAQGLQGGGR